MIISKPVQKSHTTFHKLVATLWLMVLSETTRVSRTTTWPGNA